MKQKLALYIILGLILTITTTTFANAETDDKAIIKEAINTYKTKNYLGCISALEEYTQRHKDSAIAWYYLGNSFMNVGFKDKANYAYDRVVEIHTMPRLTSLSIQAKLCMNDGLCEYKNFTKSEVEQLRADPHGFLAQINMPKEVEVEVIDERVVELEKLINGEYMNNIHPDADSFIKQENIKIEQSKMN